MSFMQTYNHVLPKVVNFTVLVCEQKRVLIQEEKLGTHLSFGYGTNPGVPLGQSGHVIAIRESLPFEPV